MAMPRHAFANDLAGGDVERREQRRRAVSLPSLPRQPAFPFSRRRRASRPEAQMGAAPSAIGAAETVERNWPAGEFFVDLTLAAAGENPGAKSRSDARQLVHMPMRLLVVPHMTPDPRRYSSGPLGRAAIDIESRREQRALCAGLHPLRLLQLNQQRVGATCAKPNLHGFGELIHGAHSP